MSDKLGTVAAIAAAVTALAQLAREVIAWKRDRPRRRRRRRR